MILSILTLTHVLISLVGIGAGLVAVYGMISRRLLDRWNVIFLWTTVATSVTGFFFPFHGFLPSHGVAILSLIVLAVALRAWYSRGLRGGWRRAYVITAVAALYFNVFVLIVQSFQKTPALKALAPTQTEPPFVATQALCLVLFVILGTLAVVRFREGQPTLAASASPR